MPRLHGRPGYLRLDLSSLGCGTCDVSPNAFFISLGGAAAVGGIFGAATVALLSRRSTRLLTDKLKSLTVEASNVRTRSMRDVAEAKKYGINKVMAGLLPTVDNLDRALLEAGSRETSADPRFAQIEQGLALTRSGLCKFLQNHGVTPTGEVVGDRFDPARQEAMMQQAPHDDATLLPVHDTIGSVLRPGWFLHDRILRPAQVGVVKGRPKCDSADT